MAPSQRSTRSARKSRRCGMSIPRCLVFRAQARLAWPAAVEAALKSLSCGLPRFGWRTAADADHVADRHRQVGAVQRVEMELMHPIRLQQSALLGGDRGGN